VGDKLERIRTWSRSTASGDIDELGAAASADVRRALTRGTDTCEGRLCPHVDACWAEKARATAARATIVVTNHYLWFADAKLRQVGGEEVTAMPLPDAPVLVLDEGHTLEDAATSAFAAQIDAERAPRILNSLRVRTALAQRNVPTFSAALQANLEAFEALDRMMGAGRTPIETEVVAGLRLSEHAWELTRAAEAIEDRDERRWVERRLRELAMDAERVFRPDDPAWVHYAERDPTRGVVATAAPIEVDRLFGRSIAAKRSVLATSATLTVGRSFDYIKTRLGMHGAQDLVTEPAFDYTSQALLYVAADLPPPPTGGADSDAYGAAIANAIHDLVMASGGRAFCLFTSYRALNDAWRRTGSRLPFHAFRQGERPAQDLLDAFRAAGDGVLFGTRSFWEGVDVPGEALSLVIITRMPFAVPDDPVVAARTERLRAEGRDWFGEFALPRATLLLKQGFGRLIRSSRDRGVVAILDSRVVTRAYGRVVLDSLPDARRTQRLDDVRAFFASEQDR
jgi:ATP-dependent DNA helicase DinG